MKAVAAVLDAMAMTLWPIVGLIIAGYWQRREPIPGMLAICAVWGCLSIGIRAGIRLVEALP